MPNGRQTVMNICGKWEEVVWNMLKKKRRKIWTFCIIWAVSPIIIWMKKDKESIYKMILPNKWMNFRIFRKIVRWAIFSFRRWKIRSKLFMIGDKFKNLWIVKIGKMRIIKKNNWDNNMTRLFEKIKRNK